LIKKQQILYSKNLPFWHELVGDFKGLFKDKKFAYVRINDITVAFQLDSDEARQIEKFSHLLTTSKIGILRTDLSEKPFVFRMIV